MRITSSKVPSHLKPLTRKAVKFFAANVADQEKFDFEHIHVAFVESKCHAEAWCDINDPEHGVKPTEFIIEVNMTMLNKQLKPKHYTEILFHELTHAWQFAKGKLVIEDYRTAKYGNKCYDLKEFEYFLQPWEIEAYGYQYCMNRLFWDDVSS